MEEKHKKIHQKVMASLKKAQQKLGFSDEKVQAILDTPATAAEEERLKKDMQQFGKELKAAREDAGLSLEELSKKAGVPIASIQLIEAGLGGESITVVYDIVKALGGNLKFFSRKR